MFVVVCLLGTAVSANAGCVTQKQTLNIVVSDLSWVAFLNLLCSMFLILVNGSMEFLEVFCGFSALTKLLPI